jgi:hypothetical protein
MIDSRNFLKPRSGLDAIAFGQRTSDRLYRPSRLRRSSAHLGRSRQGPRQTSRLGHSPCRWREERRTDRACPADNPKVPQGALNRTGAVTSTVSPLSALMCCSKRRRRRDRVPRFGHRRVPRRLSVGWEFRCGGLTSRRRERRQFRIAVLSCAALGIVSARKLPAGNCCRAAIYLFGNRALNFD